MWLYHRVKSPNDADGMANSVDPDQTAPLGVVWSGSALFAQVYLSENLGSLWYTAKPFEPSHEIMVLFIPRNLILQTCVRSHPMELDVWFLVGPFIYFHTLCVRTAKAVARLHGCAGSPEPWLRRLTWALAGRLCYKHHKLMSWLV